MLSPLVAALAVASAAGGAFAVAPARGQEARLLEDARDGRLDSLDLLEAALVASGVPDAELDRVRTETRAALKPAVERARRRSTPDARGRALLIGLHDTVLARYDANATDIDDVLRTGEFNCLSSALLFMVAAQDLGLDATGMVTTRHAFARVRIDGKVFDVETTVPTGFGIDRARALDPALLARIAPDATDRASLLEDLKRPEELPTLSLVAGIYANRSVALVTRGALAAAATALDRATRLATGNARARFASWRASVINNGARELIEEGRLDDAQALLELALEGADGEIRDTLRTNLGRTHLRKADALATRDDWRGVLAEVERADALGVGREVGNLRALARGKLAAESLDDRRCVGSDDDVAACLALLCRAFLDSGDPRRALQAARKAHSVAPRNTSAREAVFFALQAHAQARLEAQACSDVEAAAREMETLKDVLGDQAWSGAALMASCWGRRGARAWDAQRWDEAAAAWRRALAHTPTERAWQQNLARVDLNRALEKSKAGACDEARPLVRRAVHADRSLTADGARVLESCANARAVAAARREAWAEAATEARRGLVDVPRSDLLGQNLRAMLNNLAIAHLKAGRCDDARAALEELEELEAPGSPPRRVGDRSPPTPARRVGDPSLPPPPLPGPGEGEPDMLRKLQNAIATRCRG